MKTKIQIIILLTLILINFKIVVSQVTGYGSGTPLSDPNISSGTTYMDNNRAALSTYTPSGINASIATTNLHGSFSVGDIALIIQMNGSNAGIHQNVEITSVSSGYPTSITTVSGSSMLSYSTSDKVQIIKINEYVDFTLSGTAIITCHPYDFNDGSGGILCMIVNGTLHINGGLFTVAGKGHTYQESGVTFGNGGNGGAGQSTSNGAGPASLTSACLDGQGTVTLNAGSAGGTQMSNGAAGTANAGLTGAITWPASTKVSKLILGTPGYYKSASPTYGAAGGGAGGGAGGTGGNSSSPCNASGAAGSSGGAGKNGGDAGVGGIGGGSIIIKATDIDINNSVTYPVFIADGTNGANGGVGGSGGAGGTGGAGGIGCCNPFGSNDPMNAVPMGAPGGYGEDGNPGAGGDGGNGGQPGFIWISALNSYSPSSGRGVHFRIKGGKSGKGGPGGLQNAAPSGTLLIFNECSATFCPATPVCDNTYCNLDKVMCVLASTTGCAATNPFNSDIIDFWSSSTPPSPNITNYSPVSMIVAQYNKYSGEIMAFENGGCNGTYVHVANLYNAGICGLLFEKMAGISSFNNSPENVDFGMTASNSCTDCAHVGNPALDINIDFISSTYFVLASYTFSAATGIRKLYSGIDFMQCDNAPCAVASGWSGAPNNWGWLPSSATQSGTTGRDGDDGTDGGFDDSNSDPNTNASVDEPSNWFTTVKSNISSNNSIGAKLYPNPTTDGIWVQFNYLSNNRSEFEIYDATGKLVLKSSSKITAGDNKIYINTAKIASGNYIIKMIVGNKIDMMRFDIIK